MMIATFFLSALTALPAFAEEGGSSAVPSSRVERAAPAVPARRAAEAPLTVLAASPVRGLELLGFIPPPAPDFPVKRPMLPVDLDPSDPARVGVAPPDPALTHNRPKPSNEEMKKNPLGALSDRDRRILAAAGERIAQKLLPWLDFKLLRRLEILQTLRLENVSVNWNVMQKPGQSFRLGGERRGSPLLVRTKTALDLVPHRWNLEWQMTHPLDERPFMHVKSQVWMKGRYHADVGYEFVPGDRLFDVLRDGPTATLGCRLGMYGIDYRYGNAEHTFALTTLF